RRLVTPSLSVKKRVSVASAAASRASQKRCHCRSEPTATAISPSAVANVSYGTMFGWALPPRPGDSPVANAFWAWLMSTASVDSRIETSIRCPPAPPTDFRSRPTANADPYYTDVYGHPLDSAGTIVAANQA